MQLNHWLQSLRFGGGWVAHCLDSKLFKNHSKTGCNRSSDSIQDITYVLDIIATTRQWTNVLTTIYTIYNKNGTSLKEIIHLMRVYIPCGCAWTFWSCAATKNKVTPLCQMIPTATNHQQCHSNHHPHHPPSTSEVLPAKWECRGPKWRLASLGPSDMVCIISLYWY